MLHENDTSHVMTENNAKCIVFFSAWTLCPKTDATAPSNEMYISCQQINLSARFLSQPGQKCTDPKNQHDTK